MKTVHVSFISQLATHAFILGAIFCYLIYITFYSVSVAYTLNIHAQLYYKYQVY